MSKNFELILRGAQDESLRALVDTRAASRPPRRPRFEVCDDPEILPLVRRLLLASEARRHLHTVMFASVDALGQSGAVCVRVARALAAAEAGTICLVDANLSSPSMHRTFGVSQAPGLTEAIRQEGSCRFMAQTVAPGLSLLTSGSYLVEPRSGITTEHAKALLDDLGSSFDWVLGDIGQAGDTSGLAGAADGLVLVVEAHATRRAIAQKAAEDLVAAGGRLVGTVLADRRFPIPEAIYRRL